MSGLRTQAIKRKLPEDSEADARAAVSAGWRIDSDDWWWRWRGPQDIVIGPGNAHFGFTNEDLPNDDKVFVRSAAYALAFDRGEVTPYE